MRTCEVVASTKKIFKYEKWEKITESVHIKLKIIYVKY